MKRFVRPDIASMQAYGEEPEAGLNLMANTNLFGVNPAIAKGLAQVHAGRLSEYPSLTSNTMRAAVARTLGVGEDMLVTGNGSNEIIDVLLRTFLSPGDRVAFPSPTFSMIPTFAHINHGATQGVPLDAHWALDPDALLATRAKITFIVRPNNPTGNAFPRADVERILHESEGLVVVDEAYVEFLGGESFVKEVREGHDRLIVLRTLSKAHGLAGLRIGYGVASADITREITKVRGPFKLNVISETIGALAVADEKYVEDVVAGVRSERPALKRMLEARGFSVFPSDANFFLVKPPTAAGPLAKALAARDIWVRELGGTLSPYLRITVGPPEVTKRLADALDIVMGKGEAP